MKLVCPHFRSVKFNKPSTHKIVAEEIVEDVTDGAEPPAKVIKLEVMPSKSTETKKEAWNKSIGVMSKKPALSNLVRSRTAVQNGLENITTVSAERFASSGTSSTVVSSKENVIITDQNNKPAGSSLSLLANYSDSGTDSDNQ